MAEEKRFGLALRWVIWGFFALALAGCWFNPINNETYRALFLISLVGFLFAQLLIIPWQLVRFGYILILIVIGYFVMNPTTEPIDLDSARARHLKTLERFENVHYKFGGESILGVDSVGLAKRTMIESMLIIAVEQRRWGLLKDAYVLWSTPLAFTALTKKDNPFAIVINPVDYPKLLYREKLAIGDLLISPVNLDGAIYMGNKKWLLLLPGDAVVKIETFPGTRSSLFRDWSIVVRPKFLTQPSVATPL